MRLKTTIGSFLSVPLVPKRGTGAADGPDRSPGNLGHGFDSLVYDEKEVSLQCARRDTTYV